MEADREIVGDSDIRAIIRLLGDVAFSEEDFEGRKAMLMGGLVELIGADYWGWGLATELQPGKLPVFTSITHGGFSDNGFSKFLVAFEHPDMADITEPLIVEIMETGEHITRSSSDFDPDFRLAQSPALRLWEEADVGPTILSFRPLERGCLSVIGLYRKFVSPPFNSRETKIAHLLLTEVPWLHLQGWPWEAAAEVPKLARQPRLVLNLMLEGLSRKEIAERMDLSSHTVNDYAKTVFKSFGVQSQTMLMAKFRSRVET